MALPYSNTTCDIYRANSGPPAAPDVPGVKCALEPRGQSSLTTPAYTHVLLVGPTVDVRDGFTPGTFSFDPNRADVVYIPDRNGVKYVVVLVRRQGRGTALDHKQVLLQRVAGTQVNWPTNDV
jgi:hypothetical protein